MYNLKLFCTKHVQKPRYNPKCYEMLKSGISYTFMYNLKDMYTDKTQRTYIRTTKNQKKNKKNLKKN